MKIKSVVVALGLCGLTAGGFVGGVYYKSQEAQAQSKTPAAPAPTATSNGYWTEGGAAPAKGAMPSSFSDLAKLTSPAVVFISTKQNVKRAPMFPEGHPFHDFFGPGENNVQQGLGSGFLINKKGFILTNYHVVDGADEIQVTLEDGNSYPGKVVGSDAKTDVALVKIEASTELPILTFGDSESLQVGDWVVAIGNPFGLDHTVTAGIVSAKGRGQVDPGKVQDAYHDFIQTDASINPGNSGGPLLNVKGEVIGINTAINAAGQGIGFAIPIAMVKDILPQLAETGKVSRSWLGVRLGPVSSEVAKKAGLTRPEGALISDVVQGSPADLAGMKPNDIVVGFAGKNIKRYEELRWAASIFGAGKTTEIKVLREGKPVALQITLKSFPSEEEQIATRKLGGQSGVSTNLGVSVTAVTKELAEKFGAVAGQGVLVTSVANDSPANGRIQVGDIILSIGERAQLNKTIATPEEFQKVIEGFPAEKTMLAYVLRNGGYLFVAIGK